jgi:oligopeptide/dipeptide ABC transporter ATP-binding protein
MSADQPSSVGTEQLESPAPPVVAASKTDGTATASWRTGAAGARAGGPPVLEVRNLRVQFNVRGHMSTAVDGLSYSLSPGRTLAIIGESGSGKTVSSRAVMGLLPGNAVVTGSVRLEGQELLNLSEGKFRAHLGPSLAMVFQDPARSLNPTMRIGAQITEAIRLHFPMDKKAAYDRAIELLQRVRLPDAPAQFYKYPHQLSGGMRQRVMIAIALACQPKVLFADEATSSLDVTTQARIMQLLVDLQDELNMAVVLISHNLGLAASFSDEVVVIYAGHVVEQGPTRQLFAHVRMPYTKLLLDAVPRVERPAHTIMAVAHEASPFAMGEQPSGCAFASRCPRAQNKCLEEVPPLEEDGSTGHRFACWFPHEDGAA